jgi:ribosome recycling factor
MKAQPLLIVQSYNKKADKNIIKRIIMINEVKNEAQTRMAKSVESFKSQLAKVRTGRAHPSLLDGIMVSYYGSNTPLRQVGNVSTEDARTLTVTVFDATLVPVVEKAIMGSNLGLNPMSAGTVIRIPLPPLTEERRKELIKVVRGEAENSRVAIRNIRRDANNDLKTMEKDKDISEDEQRLGEENVQKITNEFVKQIDDILAVKEKELLEV